MATISSAGIGSGLDVAGIVEKLMTVERQPITQLDRKESSYNTQLSALGQLKSSLATLQTAAQAFSTPLQMLALKSSVLDTSIASARVTNSAAAGSYALEVTRLASQNKLVSSAFGSSSTSLGAGAGSLTIEFGSVDPGTGAFTLNSSRSAVTIGIAADRMTPAGVRDVINGAGLGVTASLLNDGTGTRLIITNDQSGAQQSMRIAVGDPDGNDTDANGLSALAYDPAATAGSGKNMTQLAAAADAAFTLDGLTMSSTSNTIANVIDGLTLTLTKTNTGSPTTLTIAQDDEAIRATIDSFVSAYNALATQLRTLTKYDASTDTAAVLQGDSTVRSIQQQLRSTLTTAFGSGSVARLADIGLTLQTDGSLKFDEAKFGTAFANHRDAVVGLFTKDAAGAQGKGLGGVFDDLIDRFTGIDGLLTARTEGIGKRISDLDDQRERIEARLEQVRARYERQFTALDIAVSKSQGLSAYLTQQLASLPGAGDSGKN